MIEPIPFEASIVDHAGVLIGEISEPGPPGDPGDTAHALINGVRADSTVRFTKVYDTLTDDPVIYEGTIAGDGKELHGRWTIPGGESGPFVMRRSQATPAAVEAEEQVSI